MVDRLKPLRTTAAGAVADTDAPGEIWVADRNFCVAGFLHAIEARAAFFVIRQHGGLTTKPLEAMRRVGTSETGAVLEQAVPLRTGDGEWWSLLRITVTVKRKSHNGDTVSEYYLASAIATTLTGLGIAFPKQEWASLPQARPEQLAACLPDLAHHVDLRKLRKPTRGPKKPPNPRTRFKGQPHVSTAKFLAESRQSTA